MIRRMKATIKQIARTHTPLGNSGHVVVPKDWIEKGVIVKVKEN
jgi:putative transposon-encoded protein